jgi:hypothetical protein
LRRPDLLHGFTETSWEPEQHLVHGNLRIRHVNRTSRHPKRCDREHNIAEPPGCYSTSLTLLSDRPSRSFCLRVSQCEAVVCPKQNLFSRHKRLVCRTPAREWPTPIGGFAKPLNYLMSLFPDVQKCVLTPALRMLSVKWSAPPAVAPAMKGSAVLALTVPRSM